MEDDTRELTWREVPKGWLLFCNNYCKNKRQQSDDSEKNKKSSSLFYYTTRKPEAKGTIVYTPLGYGIIQEIKEINEKIPIKLNSTGKIHEIEPEKVFVDIPISISFISSLMNGSDTLTIPITSSPKDIIAKIESSLNKDTREDSIVNVQVFFKGRDISQQSNYSMEKLGVIPDSKFLAMPEIGAPFTLSRFERSYEGWGYSDKCINSIAFSTNKSIKIRGFGIYCADKSYGTEGSKSFSIIAKFISGTDDTGQILFSKDVLVTTPDNPEDKIFRFYFDRPLRIKAGETYACVEEAVGNFNCYTHYGDSGLNEVIGEKDVVFTFVESFTHANNTNRSCGQIPEIYYYA